MTIQRGSEMCMHMVQSKKELSFQKELWAWISYYIRFYPKELQSNITISVDSILMVIIKTRYPLFAIKHTDTY
jgi:hypothetical protein